jgi:hypothetical protein
MMFTLGLLFGLLFGCAEPADRLPADHPPFAPGLAGPGTHTAAWQPPAPDTSRRVLSDTAVQLFKQLPATAFLPAWLAQQPLSVNERLGLLARQDLPNGYLVLRGTGPWHWDGSTQLAVFPDTAQPGTYTVLVNCTDCNYRAFCSNHWSAWRWNRTALEDVTTTAFAALTPAQLAQQYATSGGRRAAIRLQDVFPEVPPAGLRVRFVVEEPALAAQVAVFEWRGQGFVPVPDTSSGTRVVQ